MITAKEAREISDTPRKFSIIERIYEVWLCGKINKEIERAIKLRQHFIVKEFSPPVDGELIRKIRHHYKTLGYEFGIAQYYNTIEGERVREICVKW